MKVKALKTLGGVVNAHAGEEFELANEAVLHDLLNQGVIVPVESNPQEVARIHHLNSEQLEEARQQHVQQTNLNQEAYAEAVQHANNQKIDQQEQEAKQAFEQARTQADQQAQQTFQQEEALRQAQVQADQMQQQVRQEAAIQKAQAQQQATQRNQQTKSQTQAQATKHQ